jgi:hypothetical protein
MIHTTNDQPKIPTLAIDNSLQELAANEHAGKRKFEEAAEKNDRKPAKVSCYELAIMAQKIPPLIGSSSLEFELKLNRRMPSEEELRDPAAFYRNATALVDFEDVEKLTKAVPNPVDAQVCVFLNRCSTEGLSDDAVMCASIILDKAGIQRLDFTLALFFHGMLREREIAAVAYGL